jgi:hypothetical protein
MTHRWLPLLVILAAAPLAADEPEHAADAVKQAATALGNGDAAAFAAAFDPSMAGLAALRAAATELWRQADVQSSIQFRTDAGDDRSHTLQMDWELRIVEREASKAVTGRQARVTCRVDFHGGHWRISSFEPSDFFEPPHVDGAWDVLHSAAAALNDGNAAGFLSSFDPSMPDYEQVRSGVMALVTEGEVQSSIDLVANDGTDVSRALEVDWTLQIVDEDTNLRRGGRDARVKCRVELQGKRWRITRLEPADFFGAILLGMNLPHDGEGRGVLCDGHLKRDGALRRNAFHFRAHCAQA